MNPFFDYHSFYCPSLTYPLGNENKWMLISSEAVAGITTEKKMYCFSKPWEAREPVCVLRVKGYDTQPHKVRTKAWLFTSTRQKLGK